MLNLYNLLSFQRMLYVQFQLQFRKEHVCEYLVKYQFNRRERANQVYYL